MVSTPSIVQTRGLSKSFNGISVLRDINIKLDSGEITALVGANGAGKTTFVKLLYGEIQPSKGYIELSGERVIFSNPKNAIESGIVKVSQDFDLFDEMSIAENIFLRKSKGKNTFVYKKNEATNFALNIFLLFEYNIDINKKVSQLNVMEKQIVSIAKAISRDPKILILDEPTSVLDEVSCASLFRILKAIKKRGTAIIFISHKLDEILSIADKIIVLKDGEATLETERSGISKDDILYAMLGKKENLYSNLVLKKTNINKSPFLRLIKCSGIGFKDISFEIAKSETIGLISHDRQSIINIVKTIYGLSELNNGTIEINNEKSLISSPRDAIKKAICFIPDDRRNEGIFYNFDLFNNITMSIKRKYPFVSSNNKRKLEKLAIGISKKLNIVSTSLEQSISEISGGNQQKTLFARWLIDEMQLILLIEPTAGIDIKSKSEIYRMIEDLKAEGKCLLIVTSDKQELLQVCDRIIKISNGVIEGVFNKSQYMNNESFFN